MGLRLQDWSGQRKPLGWRASASRPWKLPPTFRSGNKGGPRTARVLGGQSSWERRRKSALNLPIGKGRSMTPRHLLTRERVSNDFTVSNANVLVGRSDSIQPRNVSSEPRHHRKQPLFAQRSVVSFVERNKQRGSAIADGILQLIVYKTQNHSLLCLFCKSGFSRLGHL